MKRSHKAHVGGLMAQSLDDGRVIGRDEVFDPDAEFAFQVFDHRIHVVDELIGVLIGDKNDFEYVVVGPRLRA